MSETSNISNALVILGTLYFYFIYNLNVYVSASLVIFACGTWTYHHVVKEQLKLLNAQIRLTEAKAEYFKRKQ